MPTAKPTPTPTPEKPEEQCEHSFQDTIVLATCQNGGYTTHVCTKCGYSYTDSVTPPENHLYENGFCVWCGEPSTDFSWLTSGIELSDDIL